VNQSSIRSWRILRINGRVFFTLHFKALIKRSVFRYPDEVAGQIPMAFIVRKPGQELTEDDIVDWVAKQVSDSFCSSPNATLGFDIHKESTCRVTSG
jgi:hypothetical protein